MTRTPPPDGPTEAPAPLEFLTLGHSNHAFETFLALLAAAGATAVADVRTAPWSRRVPQFSRDPLREGLRAAGIAYSHLPELGGKPSDPAVATDGAPDYEKIAATAAFRAGLDRLVDGASRHRIVLVCAERDPLDCHRALLVGRALHAEGRRVTHLLADGGRLGHEALEAELLRRAEADPAQPDLFADPAERLAHAYRHRLRAGRGPRTGDRG